MIRRLLVSLVSLGLIAVLLAVSIPPAGAQTNGCSGLDRTGTRCVISDAINPSVPSPGNNTIRTSSPPGPKFVWLNLRVPCDAAASGGWTTLTDLSSAIFDLNAIGAAGPPAEPGLLWVGELINPATGGTNSGYASCVGTGVAPPPLPPPLPTAGEIWGAALTFEPSVNLDPYVRGLTGLDTFMWYEGPTADTVTITLNGYAVTAQLTAVEFRWDLGAPDRAGNSGYVTAAPGSADAPAAVHTYAEPAQLTVVHEIVWTGTSVVTGPGIPAGGVVIDLGTAVLATARDYGVIEVRTPLIGG